MAVELDNLHYDYREIDGYNKPFNFIMSAREPGKTSMFWLKKVYLKWKVDKKPIIYLVRRTVEITQALIDSIADTIINKFTDDHIGFSYNKGSFKDGIVDVKIGSDIFFRIVSLSIDMRRIKLAVLKNIRLVLMDEYIINPKMQERYLPSEALKIKEAYTTWRREANGILKFYFLGNPYSLFNPLFVDWNVEVAKLKRGEFYVSDTYIIHWALLNPLLRQKILELNPLYKFDEDYQEYAVEGMAINDKNIKISKLPKNFSIQFIFKVESRYIAIYKNSLYNEFEDKYYCDFIKNISSYRTIYCFDFSEMVDRSILISIDERMKLARFKNAIRMREVSYSNINVYYFIEGVYQQL